MAEVYAGEITVVKQNPQSCDICDKPLSIYQKKFFCEECEQMVCSSCQSQKEKISYMQNDVKGQHPGYGCTCVMLYNIKNITNGPKAKTPKQGIDIRGSKENENKTIVTSTSGNCSPQNYNKDDAITNDNKTTLEVSRENNVDVLKGDNSDRPELGFNHIEKDQEKQDKEKSSQNVDESEFTEENEDWKSKRHQLGLSGGDNHETELKRENEMKEESLAHLGKGGCENVNDNENAGYCESREDDMEVINGQDNSKEDNCERDLENRNKHILEKVEVQEEQAITAKPYQTNESEDYLSDVSAGDEQIQCEGQGHLRKKMDDYEEKSVISENTGDKDGGHPVRKKVTFKTSEKGGDNGGVKVKIEDEKGQSQSEKNWKKDASESPCDEKEANKTNEAGEGHFNQRQIVQGHLEQGVKVSDTELLDGDKSLEMEGERTLTNHSGDADEDKSEKSSKTTDIYPYHSDDDLEEESPEYDNLRLLRGPGVMDITGLMESLLGGKSKLDSKGDKQTSNKDGSEARMLIFTIVRDDQASNLSPTGVKKHKLFPGEHPQIEDQQSSDSDDQPKTQGMTDAETNTQKAVKTKAQKKSAKEHQLRQGTFDHTCAGCGRKDCEGNFMKLLKEMIITAKGAGFEIRNVTPDGNCMFAAAVDQLELRNDRSYSPRGLRQACVDFLKDNPNSDDGTPYCLFLDNESWEEYLSRIIQDGQWGDHMMLQSIAQVTGRSVQVIHNEEKRDWTVIETKCPKVENSDPIFLGHVGEFHYVSLRPSEYIKKIHGDEGNLEDEDFHSMENLMSLSVPSIQDSRRDMFEEDYIDTWSEVPALHLSYLIKKLIPQSILQKADYMMQTGISMEISYQEELEEIYGKGQGHKSLSQSRKSFSFSAKAVGDVVEGFYAPYINERERTQFDKGSEWTDVKVLDTLDQCKAYPKGYRGLTDMDAIIESDNVHPGYTRLLAQYPDMWGYSAYPGESAMTYYLPNNHSYFESYSLNKGEKDSRASKNIGVVSLFLNKSSALFCPLWPREAAEWKTRTRPADWPPQAAIDAIVSDGCHVEGKPHINSTNPDLEFRFCFGMAERYLATQVLTKEQRLCFMLFKSLCSQELRGEEIITSCELKSLFFYACEQLRVECWSTKLGSCLFFLLDSLMVSIQEKNIPNYFIPANNMIDHLTDDQFEKLNGHVMTLRSQPLVHMVTIAHQYGIMDAITILSKIQQDFQEFCEHRNVRRSVLGTLVPTTIEYAQVHIQDKMYDAAIETIQEAYEERLKVSTCEDQLPFTAFITQVISGFPLSAQWWFLFSADEKLGTTLCADLSMPLSPLTMEEIFPEKIANYYQGILVPMAIAENICTYCSDFSSYLLGKNRSYQAFDILEFAFQKYSDKSLQQSWNRESSVATLTSQTPQNSDISDAIIYRLYRNYFLVCQKLDRLSLCRGKMGEIEILCRRINTKQSFAQLAVYWSSLGENEKYDMAMYESQTAKNGEQI